VQSHTSDDVRRLFRAGRNTAFDVTHAQTAVDQSAAAIPPIIAERQAALYALAALMGRPVADYPRELEGCPVPPPLRQPLPIGDGAALIRRRSDVRAAERSLAAATATIGVETSQLYPQVSISGQVGFANTFSGMGSVSSFGGNIGPLLSWTFPNVWAARARIAEAGAAAQAAEAQFDGAVLTALQQTETALDAYVHEIEHNRELKSARDSAAEATAQGPHPVPIRPYRHPRRAHHRGEPRYLRDGARCFRCSDRRRSGQRIPRPGWWVGVMRMTFGPLNRGSADRSEIRIDSFGSGRVSTSLGSTARHDRMVDAPARRVVGEVQKPALFPLSSGTAAGIRGDLLEAAMIDRGEVS
jgi:hypothetical protein